MSALPPKEDIDPVNAGQLYCLSEAGYRSVPAARLWVHVPGQGLVKDDAWSKIMIVCSCNVISSLEIEAAVEDLIATDADVMLTPGMVYRTIGCQPKCGTCLRHVVQLMHAHREALQAPGYAPPGVDNIPRTV